MSDKEMALREKAVASNDVNQAAAQNLVRARVIEIRNGDGTVREQIIKQMSGSAREQVLKQMASRDDEPGKSQAVPEDPLVSLAAEGKLVEPPFDILTLAMLPEHNGEMGPIVEAMETNIEGFGNRFLPRLTEKATEELKALAHAERVKLTNFFAYASMDMSFTELRRRRRKDLETTGNAYWEIIRSANGAIQGFSHVASYQVRISVLDDEQIKVTQPILELQADGSVKIESITRYRRFRRFAQSRTVFRRGLSGVSGIRVRWFKEFGDPRQVHNRTGEILTDKEAAALPEDLLANEMEHFKIYSPRSPYGLPRYIGNLLSIFGSRAAEEINYSTFKNNNIPSMVVTVSNGMLTSGSIERIEEFIESQITQSSNWSKFLILEAEGLVEGEDGGQTKVEITPLTKDQHSDALFQEYSKNSADKTRRAWRLPPIFVGASDGYTKNTAETSRRVADEQVFAPEREDFDTWMNLKMFPYMDIIYNRFKTNSPNTTDNNELVKILANSEKTGGMTPRIAREILEDVLGKELPAFPTGFDPDVPFSLAMAEAVKNLADPAEPGQQVTALKASLATNGIDIIDVLMMTRVELEKRWLGDGSDEPHELYEDEDEEQGKG